MNRTGASVLGIDAAWTAKNPSGVALVVAGENGWSLARVSPSYAAFAEAGGNSSPSLEGSIPDIEQLISTSAALTGKRPILVAIDMPLARHPILTRRASDNAVSAAYGARHCSTHTPSSVRPGPISDNLRIAAEVNGYPLVTRNPVISGLIEVYPHPALVELTGAARRLPYKHGNRSKYWPTLSGPERIRALLAVWDRIISALEQELDHVAAKLPMPATNASPATLKAFEDMLDAVVCAWVGIKALEGNAIPYGDEHSAIWIPKSGAHR